MHNYICHRACILFIFALLIGILVQSTSIEAMKVECILIFVFVQVFFFLFSIFFVSCIRMAAVLCKTCMHVFSGRLEVRLMGCQDLLESVPGRCRVSNMSSAPGSPSESKSLRVRTGLSTRSTNGKTAKTDELSCESLGLQSGI